MENIKNRVIQNKPQIIKLYDQFNSTYYLWFNVSRFQRYSF